MERIDLNCDMGESFGRYQLGTEEAILDMVSSVNIACGFHAGDFTVMAETVQLAKDKNVCIGAHPGLPDLQGFGRRHMTVSPEEVFQMIVYQVGALQAVCHVHDVDLHHVKVHGALYHMTCQEKVYADAVAAAVADLDQRMILYGLSGSVIVTSGTEYGLPTASEVFADRRYEDDGTLLSRTHPQAVIPDANEAVAQGLRMVEEGVVTSVNDKNIPVTADTMCVHGDSKEALSFVRALQGGFRRQSIDIRGLGE